MSRFVPEGHRRPKQSNNYMKLEKGENKIRILTSAIFGWEDWINDRPVRYKYTDIPPKANDPKKPVHYFRAFVVWNYNLERIQILSLTQVSIIDPLDELTEDPTWGSPAFYDLKIMKEEKSGIIKYSVTPFPHKAVGKEIIDAFNANRCYLDALFDGADPFSPEWGQFTPGIFEKESNTISQEQIIELENIFDQCSPDYFTQVMSALKRSSSAINELADIPFNLFERIKNAALKKKEEYLATQEPLPF